MSRSLSVSRRRFLQSTAIGAAALSAPSVLRAQGAAVKVGVLHPVSGALSYSGQQGRIGAQLAPGRHLDDRLVFDSEALPDRPGQLSGELGLQFGPHGGAESTLWV